MLNLCTYFVQDLNVYRYILTTHHLLSGRVMLQTSYHSKSRPDVFFFLFKRIRIRVGIKTLQTLLDFAFV